MSMRQIDPSRVKGVPVYRDPIWSAGQTLGASDHRVCCSFVGEYDWHLLRLEDIGSPPHLPPMGLIPQYVTEAFALDGDEPDFPMDGYWLIARTYVVPLGDE